MTNFADRTIWTGDNLDILRGLNSASVDSHLPGPAVQLQPQREHVCMEQPRNYTDGGQGQPFQENGVAALLRSSEWRMGAWPLGSTTSVYQAG